MPDGIILTGNSYVTFQLICYDKTQWKRRIQITRENSVKERKQLYFNALQGVIID